MGVPLFKGAANARTFYDLLREQGRNIETAGAELDRLMCNWPDDSGLRARIKQLEEEGDRITHDVLYHLHTSSVTPLDREDIHSLASALDDVVDFTEEVADFMGLYKIEAPMEQALELTAVLRQATGQLCEALDRLDRLGEMSPHLSEVDRLEDDGDRINRKALVALFAGGIDPMVVIRWKDIFERLEQAIDSCECAAHILEGIAVKHA